MTEAIMKFMHEVCPYRIGSRVKIAPSCPYHQEWIGTYTVVGMFWDYQRGNGHEINIAIAADEDIAGRHGSTDGWQVKDLLPADAP